METKERVSILSVLANLFLAIGKTAVGIISKSASILADGINSGTDVVSSAISYIGIKVAKKPADIKHPYGHEKAEVIAGFVITIIILASAIFIIYDAIMGFTSTQPIKLTTLSFIVMGSSAFINFIMSQLKLHYGKKYESFSLISDGLHSRIDLLVSLAIFTGLFFIKYYQHIDSIMALLVGIYILKESLSLGKQTTDSLLGVSAGKEIESQIKKIAKQQKVEITKLKTQKLGSKIFAELEIKLPSKLKVEQATYVTKRLEQTLSEKIKGLEYISIQIASHDVGIGYYHTPLGRGFGWQRRGKFRKSPKTKGAGPGGFCICQKCGYKIKHERGTPCSTIKCPKCNLPLTRE